jgi:hypothetical protein
MDPLGWCGSPTKALTAPTRRPPRVENTRPNKLTAPLVPGGTWKIEINELMGRIIECDPSRATIILADGRCFECMHACMRSLKRRALAHLL